MYVAQYGPRDLILGAGCQLRLSTSLDTLFIPPSKQFSLALLLKSAGDLTFKFFLIGSGKFDIEVDGWTNSTENMSLDYLNQGDYIAPQSTSTLVVGTNVVGVLTHIYTELDHKSDQDRALFRFTNTSGQNINLANVLVKE